MRRNSLRIRESKHLPTAFARTLGSNIQAAATLSQFNQIANHILSNGEHIQKIAHSKRYVDDKKLTDHHAITITDVPVGRKSLTPGEAKIHINKSLMKGKITPTDMKKLLAGRETREIYFTWKSGKKGKAKL